MSLPDIERAKETTTSTKWTDRLMEASALFPSFLMVIGRTKSRRGSTATAKRRWGGAKTDTKLGRRLEKPSVNDRQTGMNHALDMPPAAGVSLHIETLACFETNKRALHCTTTRSFTARASLQQHLLDQLLAIPRSVEDKRPLGQITQQWRMLTRKHNFNLRRRFWVKLPLLENV